MIKLLFPPGTDEQQVAQEYGQLAEVVAATPNYVTPAQFYSEDIEKQWYLRRPWESTTSCLAYDQPSGWTCYSAADIGIDDAWAITRGNPYVKIAFLDSGADMQHPDLFGAYAFNPGEDVDHDGIADLCPTGETEGDINGSDDDKNNIDDDVLLGYALVQDGVGLWHTDWRHWPEQIVDHHCNPVQFVIGHGTKVAGLLGAITGNGTGIASVAGGQSAEQVPGVRLIQFSLRGDQFNIPTDMLIATFYYARAYGAWVYSLSLTVPWYGLVPSAVHELESVILFVAAVGNGNHSYIENAFATIPEVMAVGGYDCKCGNRWKIPDNHERHDGSDYGPELSLLGPSDDYMSCPGQYERMVMLSTAPTNTYPPNYDCNLGNDDDIKSCFGGTSAATPIVASVAALVTSYIYEHMAIEPDMRLVKRILEHTAEDVLSDPERSCNCESGQHCLDMLGWDVYSGFGRVDAGRALTLPIAVLQPMPTPYAILGRVTRFSWSAEDINDENGSLGPGAHFELDYLIPEHGLEDGWVEIDHGIPWDTSWYDWSVADSASVGSARRIRLTVVDSGGNRNIDYTPAFPVFASEAAVGAQSADVVPTILAITPNPNGGLVRIECGIGRSGPIRAEVIDVGGRCVREIANEWHERGRLVLRWDGRDGSGRRCDSGIYFLRLSSDGKTRTGRLVMIR